MSKVIEPSAFLSEFDRQYLLDRGKNPEDYLIEEDPEDPTDDVPPYSDWQVKALKREIDERNAERETPIEVAEPGNKPELIAALEADDASVTDDDDEDGA